MKYITLINDRQFDIEIHDDGTILLDGRQYKIDFLPLGGSQYSVITDSQSFEISIDEEDDSYALLLGGRLYEGKVLDERALLIGQRRGKGLVTSGEIRSPMPGLIIDIPVQVGDQVSEGETIVVLEAMKMQNELKAPIDGIVDQILIQVGQTVDKNTSLVQISNNETQE